MDGLKLNMKDGDKNKVETNWNEKSRCIYWLPLMVDGLVGLMSTSEMMNYGIEKLNIYLIWKCC